MTIVTVGVSHRIAPAEMLEKLAVPAAELGGVLARLHAVPGIDEVVALSSCNRVEVYAAASGPARQVARAVADLMAARGSAKADEVLRLARTRVGGAAAEHLFSVACGPDSMAVGEDQIVAQIKDAARAARATGTTGPVITRLIDAALRASKRARTQTAISSQGHSLARAGLDLAARRTPGRRHAGRPRHTGPAPGRPRRTRPDPPGPGHGRRRSRRIHGPAGPGRRGAGYRRDARADQTARRRRTGPAARPVAGAQRTATGRDRGHHPPHPAQGPAPADRAGQGVLHRPGRAPLPRRAAAALRSRYG